jgi:hypothetical protein
MLLRVLYPACPHITPRCGRAGLRRRDGRPARRALAAGRRGGAAAGRDRAGAAGQRQAARQRCRCRPAPTARPSRPPRWPAPSSRSSPKASRRRRWWWCRAGWSTWWSERLPRPRRRSRCCWPPAAAAARLLAGCGFTLRRAAAAGLRAHRADRLCAALAAGRATQARGAGRAGAGGVEAAGAADVVLQALLDARERSVVASTAAAQVRECSCAALRFSAHTPGGRLLMPPAELLLRAT